MCLIQEHTSRCTGTCASMANEIPEFPFPYQPYPIQEQFMRALYGALEDSKVGIFESPTGTVRCV